MRIDLIPIGKNPPDDLNVIIEVPTGGEPVKYEFDKASGALFVDRILHTPMRYPANYGFVPHTLSPDGDPLDALVDRALAVHPGLRRARAADRGAEPGGRGRRRREARLRAGRHDVSPITRTSASATTCPRSCSSRSSTSSPTTRTWRRRSGCASAPGATRDEARRITLEAIERYNAAKDDGEEPHEQDDSPGARD